MKSSEFNDHQKDIQDVRDAGYDKVVTGKGEEYYAKLNDDTVMKTRESIRNGPRPPELSKEYNINNSAVYKIARGESWGHVPGAITKEELPNLRIRLRKDDIPIIRERVWNGEPASSLAKEFDVDVNVITDVAVGKYWGNIPGALQ